MNIISQEIEKRREIAKNLTADERKDLSKMVKASFEGIDIYRSSRGESKGTYDYVFYSIGEGNVSQELLEAIGLLFAWHAFKNNHVEKADALFTEADYGGGQVMTTTGSYTGLKLCWVNQYNNGMFESVPRIVPVIADPGFRPDISLGLCNLEGVKDVIIVDDMISTGGTFIDLLPAMIKTGVNPLAFYTVGEKIAYNGRSAILKKYPNLPIVTLAQFEHEIFPDAEERFKAGKPVGITHVVNNGNVFYE